MAKNSKNQRGAKPNSTQYVEAGNTIRFVPLGAGFCYIRDPRDGKIHHVKVASESFVEKVTEISASYPIDKMKAEISNLARSYPEDSWKIALSKL